MPRGVYKRTKQRTWKLTPETRAKMSEAQRKKSPEHRAKISEALRGREVSPETRAKISAKLKTVYQDEKTHPRWKGDNAGYVSMHMWVSKRKTKTGVCSKCGKTVGVTRGTGTDWANIDHRYRRVLNDYIELCRWCHRTHDRTLRSS